MHDEILTVSVPEAGRLLGISRGLAFRLCKSGQIQALRLGKKRLRVPKSAIEAMLNAGKPKVDSVGGKN